MRVSRQIVRPQSLCLLLLLNTITLLVSFAPPATSYDLLDDQRPRRIQGLFNPGSFNLVAQYVPPTEPSSPGRTTSGGSRGPSDPAIPIAPSSYIGKTTSTHPTLVWFVPAKRSIPIGVELRDITDGMSSKSPLIYSTQLQSQTGWMQLSLPKKYSALKVDRQYAWQLRLILNENRPSEDQLIVQKFLVVPSPYLDQRSQSPQSRVQYFVRQGIWYDALTTTLAIPDPVSRQALLRSLVNSLAGTETDPNVVSSLRQIAALDKP